MFLHLFYLLCGKFIGFTLKFRKGNRIIIIIMKENLYTYKTCITVVEQPYLSLDLSSIWCDLCLGAFFTVSVTSLM